MFCNSCGAEIPDDASVCSQCGKNPRGNYTQNVKNVKPESSFTEAKSRVAAGLLQIFLAAFGAGRFYLGYTHIAIMQIFLNFITGGTAIIWPIIDGILILCGKPQTDAHGKPLI